MARARTADATIRNRLTAFNTGVAPSRIRPYIITVSGEFRDPAREGEDRDAEDDSRNDERRQHQDGQELLAGEAAALDQKSVSGAQQHGEHGDPHGNGEAGPDAAEKLRIGKQSRASDF